MKVGITTSSFAEFDNKPLQILKDSEFECVLNPYGRKLSSEELIKLICDCCGVVAGTELLNKEVLTKLPLLKVISRCGVGMDNVDLKAAEEFGIKVYNTPYGPTLAVAELTVSMILNLLRKTSFMDSQMRKGIWKKEWVIFLQVKK